MPCKGTRRPRFKRVRAVDVGRPGHHYLVVGVRGSAGSHGGRTQVVGGLRTFVVSHSRHGKRGQAHHVGGYSRTLTGGCSHG